MKFNFSKIKCTDIEGAKVPNTLHKTVANIMWRLAKSVDLVDTAIFKNRGEEVELDKLEIEEIRKLIEDPSQGVFAYARKAIFEYIDRVQESNKKKKKHSKKNRK